MHFQIQFTCVVKSRCIIYMCTRIKVHTCNDSVNTPMARELHRHRRERPHREKVEGAWEPTGRRGKGGRRPAAEATGMEGGDQRGENEGVGRWCGG
jgi:hypothetical protein